MGSKRLKHVSDEKLVALLTKNDEEAFEEIYNRYWETLFSYAYNVLSNPSAAKDVVQNIFINIWERRDKLSVHNLYAYLLQSVKYRIASSLRKNRLDDRQLSELKFIGSANTTEENLVFKESKEEILAHLEHVPARSREVFCMSRFDNFTNQEIAENLGISIRTVETHISKVLKYLREQMKTLA